MRTIPIKSGTMRQWPSSTVGNAGEPMVRYGWSMLVEKCGVIQQW